MNPKSIIFLLILVSIVLFLVGINLGKEIEKVDKSSIPAKENIKISPTGVPTPSKPVSFKEYNNPSCGISLTYPDYLQAKESSSSASFMANQDLIKFSCATKNLTQFDIDKKTFASPSALVLKTNDTRFSVKSIPIYTIKDHQLFTVTNNINGKRSLFETSQNLTSLVINSLQFTR